MRLLFVLLGAFFGTNPSASFLDVKPPKTPSPTKASQAVDPDKAAKRHHYECSIEQLESMINSRDLKSEFVFAALRGIAQNYEYLFDLEIGSIDEQRSYLYKAIETYLQIMQLCKSDKDLNSIAAADSLLKIQNMQRNFELKHLESK